MALVALIKNIRILLKTTLAVLVAGRARPTMLDEQQFQHGFANTSQFLGIGVYDQAFADFKRAGRLQATGVFHLDQAEPARTGRFEPRIGTEIRDLNTVVPGSLQDCLVFSTANDLALKGKLNVFSFA